MVYTPPNPIEYLPPSQRYRQLIAEIKTSNDVNTAQNTETIYQAGVAAGMALGGGSSAVYTYSPGVSVPESKIYPTWAATYAARAAVPTPAVIMIDSFTSNDGNLPEITAGTWDMQDTVLA